MGRGSIGALLVATLLVGCSSGDDTESATTSERTTTTTTAAPPPPTVTPMADRSLAITSGPAPDLAGFNIHRPEDLDATGAPLPVIVWANGGCVRHDATWTPLFERWAAAGFVVLSITALPDRVPSLADPSSSADQGAAIDWAADQDAAAGGTFAGRLDLDRVIAAGNSCGGITSIGLAASDPRVHAVFVLSGSSTLPGAPRDQVAEVMGAVEVPVGYVVGGPEDIAGAQAAQDLELLGADIGGFVASRDTADHVTVSTDPAILDEVAAISLTWFDLVLTGSETAADELAGGGCAECPTGRWTVTAKDLDVLAAR